MPQVIKKGDLELVLLGAAALQARDLNGDAINQLIQSSENGLPISAVYELAESSLGIPKEYIDRYLQTLFPSRERKLDTIKRINANPVCDAVILTYQESLLDELRKNFPSIEFDAKHVEGYSTIFNILRRTKKESMFGRMKEKVERSRLAMIKVQGDSHISEERGYEFINQRLEFDIYSPWFAEACKGKIKELQELFNGAEWGVKRINYHYPISE